MSYSIKTIPLEFHFVIKSFQELSRGFSNSVATRNWSLLLPFLSASWLLNVKDHIKSCFTGWGTQTHMFKWFQSSPMKTADFHCGRAFGWEFFSFEVSPYVSLCFEAGWEQSVWALSPLSTDASLLSSRSGSSATQFRRRRTNKQKRMESEKMDARDLHKHNSSEVRSKNITSL